MLLDRLDEGVTKLEDAAAATALSTEADAELCADPAVEELAAREGEEEKEEKPPKEDALGTAPAAAGSPLTLEPLRREECLRLLARTCCAMAKR
mmetsp:Transcript_22705/g.47907  ORF Transcript_22705/g.47907 Transcript_22705/m.47907 type:complete len:94 (+) Transcript_22705:4605-4886(+)